MIWVRKGVVYLLSLLLLVTLLGTAYSASIHRTVGQPEKVKTYLAESRIYDNFVAYVADQASKSEGDEQPGSVSLSDAAVQKAAKTSFPSQFIEKNVNTVIDANYAWLEGKFSVPNFKVDLTAQKAAFAERVGQIVQTYTAGLPVCSKLQTTQEKNVDPLAATCRQKDLKPAAVGAQVTEQLSTTGNFLSNPVITAESIDPNGNQQGKPYFTKLSKLPQAYRLSAKLPYIFGGLSILFALAIIFIALTKRKGFRRVGIILIIAGAVLVASKFIGDFAFNKAEDNIFNKASVGPLQKSLTDFAHRIESSLVNTNLWFGIALIVLALLILSILVKTRQKTGKKGAPEEPPTEEPTANGRLPLLKARKSLRRPFGDSIMPLGARPGGEEPGVPEEPSSVPTPAPKPKRKKKPRLIQ